MAPCDGGAGVCRDACAESERRACGDRVAQVWAQLDRVTDPELDEPVTEMGFVETVAVDRGGDVQVFFRLPTYWCSPNFAFLMAEGMRTAVAALPWVGRVTIRLEDHMAAEEMNAAVNDGRSFADAFRLRADGGDLGAVRETFERKAFQRRQEAVIAGLRAQGFDAAAVAAMTLGQLALVRFEDAEAARQLPRYRELLLARGLARGPDDHAFPDLDGRPLTVEGWSARLSALRAVRINMEFGGALCRGLKQSRYQEAAPGDGEPALIDFIRGQVPPRVAAAE